MRLAGGAGFVVFLSGAAVLAGLCFFWPLAISLTEMLTTAPWAEAALGPRRLGLLGRGVCIAAGAAVLAQLLGGGLAAGLGASRTSRVRALTAWVCLIVLLTPPYIYAYAWGLVTLPGGVVVGAAGAVRWPAWLVHEGRAIWCLGTWTSPIAATVLACGWRVSGRPAYVLALPDASSTRALVSAGLVALAPWFAVSLTITGMLALTEHSVCDLSQAPTWNTEILAALQNRPAGQGTPGALLAWPLIALVGLLLLALRPFRSTLTRMFSELSDWRSAEEVAGQHVAGRPWGGTLALSLTILVLLLPVVILVTELQHAQAFVAVWRDYPRAWPDGLLYAAGCAIVSLWLAVGIDSLLATRRRTTARVRRTIGSIALVCCLIGAVAPPALVGDAFAAAYIRWPWLSDYWPIVSLVTAARFAIIPVLALRIASGRAAAELAAMAASDGAGPLTAYFRVRLPVCARPLLTVGLIVGLLALTEVPATYLVRPAGVESVAMTLFNEIHHGRSDVIVAMSLYLIVAVGVGVTAAQWVLAQPQRRRR